MTKTRTPTRPSRGLRPRQQLSLPFHETIPPKLDVAEAQRAAAVMLLRQMLIDAVLAESRTNTIDEKKETNHE